MSVTLNGSGGLTFNDGSTQNTASLPGMRNRIINGAMMIDQRNAGASFTPTSDGVYSLDRWRCGASVTSKYSVQRNAGSVTPPVGFINYLGVTSLSAYTVGASESFTIGQAIEGLNIADFNWGTANATAITISFWVRSSLTGTFGGSITNAAFSRAYAFTYTISAANTWEQKTITIAGDTTGTWLTTNGAGLYMLLGLGTGSSLSGTANVWNSGSYFYPTGATNVVSTNGATFYITGVQLEKGSTATSFDYRPYGQELQLCQRYYYKNFPNATDSPFGVGQAYSTTRIVLMTPLKSSMRIAPTALEQSGTAAHYGALSSIGVGLSCNAVPTFYSASTENAAVVLPFASGLIAGNASFVYAFASGAYFAWSAEL